VICWGVYKGCRPLLALIVLGNLANITLFSATIPGPERYFAGRPLIIVTMVFVQIVATLALVNVLAKRPVSDTSMLAGPVRKRQISHA